MATDRRLTSAYSRTVGPFQWFLFTVIGISIVLDRTSAAGNASSVCIPLTVDIFDLLERRRRRRNVLLVEQCLITIITARV